MAIQTINIGNNANDGAGDPARSAFNKVNQNFTNNTHAASRMVGVEAGNVMEVGAYGWGSNRGRAISSTSDSALLGSLKGVTQAFRNVGISSGYFSQWTVGLFCQVGDGVFAIGSSINSNRISVLKGTENNTQYGFLYSNFNTTVDANGFIKAASPIVKLFADKIELNNEAADQNIVFQKIDLGHYLIKGSSGFAQEGWYIETPKDANGNILFAVNYEQLENGDIEVKSYKKRFDLESASIVADLENPVDITLNRWIDIRLQEVPKPVPEMPTEEVNSDEPQQ
ncbi:hypothetical protein RFH54_03455 [Acinetobacter soli]|uniref:phage tail fiber protein n=1 Tax=Acinetobacter soli TaxID=487316 RepID=UPI00280ED0A2|nr:hypothetical protein [Acinetobacter soli]MDQ8995009.1 hypothetical protein [Acinetobacter soli]